MKHKDRFTTNITKDLSVLPKRMADLECCGNCYHYQNCPDFTKISGHCDLWKWDRLKQKDRGEK